MGVPRQLERIAKARGVHLKVNGRTAETALKRAKAVETVIARDGRLGSWWAIDFVADERECSTHAKQPGQVARMVRVAASLTAGRPEDSFGVEIEVADDPKSQR